MLGLMPSMSLIAISTPFARTSITMFPQGQNNNHNKTNKGYQMAPTYTFGPSAAKTVAEELGYEIEDDTGLLVDAETGDYEIPSGREDPITIEEFGGVGKGSRVLIENDFNSISAYVEEYQQGE